jgi:hypothetical protein
MRGEHRPAQVSAAPTRSAMHPLVVLSRRPLAFHCVARIARQPGAQPASEQFDEYDRVDGRFELPPVYDFEGQVLDGGHRTRAAYYAYLRSGDAEVSLEVVCDIAALPV